MMEVAAITGTSHPQVCSACASINIESLTRTTGCERVATVESLLQSDCSMCKLIGNALNDEHISPDKKALTTIRCLLERREGFISALRVTNESTSKDNYICMFVSECKDRPS